MQNKSKKLLKLFSTILVPLILSTSCDNDPASIGLESLPQADLLEASISRQNIFALNHLPDWVRTDSDQDWTLARGIVGFYNDPIMGLVKADLITNVSLGANILDFKNMKEGEIFPDSLILSFAYQYEQWLGDKSQKLTFEVYELKDPILSSSFLYNNVPIENMYYPEVLGASTISPNLDLGTQNWGEKNNVQQIRIKLNKALAQKLLDMPDFVLSDREEFLKYFKGLYIKTIEPAQLDSIGALCRLAVFGTEDDARQFIGSNLTLYYRHELYEEDASGVVDYDNPLQTNLHNYVFPIYPEARFFNHFEHEYSGNILFDDNNTKNLFIQGMAGSQIKININDLVWQWNDSINIDSDKQKIGISSVELLFYPDSVYMGTNKAKYPNLVIAKKGKNDKYVYPTYTRGLNVYRIFSDVTFNEKENCYVFKMDSRYFEKIAVERTELEDLFLLANIIPGFNFTSLVLHNNDLKKHPVLRVKYVRHP